MDYKMKLNIQLFASSKTQNKTIQDSYGNDYKVTIQINETLPSDYLTSNNSTLSGSVKVSNTGTGGAYSSNKDMSATITFKNDNSSGTQISKKSGSTAFNFDGSATKTATPLSFSGISVPHNDNGSKTVYYTMTLKVSTTSLAQTVTMTGTIVLTDIPRGSKINNTTFDIEKSNTLQITKYVSLYYDKLQMFTLDDNNSEILVDMFLDVENGQSITVSNSKKSVYYNANKNRQDTKIILKLTTYADNTMATVIGTDTKEYDNKITTPPTFTNFDFSDINTKTTSLTGDTSIIVKGYSNVKVDIPTNKKAVANKEATIKNYNVNGTLKAYADPFSYTINNFDATELIVYAIDSRNLPTRVSKPVNLKNYTKVVKLNNEAEREGGVGSQVTFDLSGTYWNDTFGAVQNDLTATYRFKQTDGEWQTGESEIILTKNGKNYSFSGVLKGDAEDLGFDIANSYNVEIIVQDKLSSVTFAYLIGASQPAIAILKNNVALGGVYDESINKKSQIYDAFIKNADLVVENVESKNLFTGLVIGIGLNSTTGAQQSNNTKASSDYIPVDFNINQNYYISGLYDNLYSFVGAYNSNYEFLGRTSGGARNKLLISSNSFTSGTAQGIGEIAYLRVSQYEVEETSGSIQDVVNLQVQLEVGNKATSYSPFFDHIIESGENENGAWEKWASGKLVCRGLISKYVESGHTEEVSGWYVSKRIQVNFPKPFREEPMVTGNGWRTASDRNGIVVFIGGISTDSFYAWSGLLVSSTSTGWRRTYEAVGKWK